MNRIFLFLVLVAGYAKAQNFPKLGSDTALDVACWNIEWFGDVTNGPSDEQVQADNVKYLLQRTGMDVFALEEISAPGAYATLSSALAATYDTYISTFSQTQKTGIYWRKSMFSLIPSLTQNISLTSSESYNFASRPPLQVALKTVGGTRTDTLIFLVLHMKALGDLDSYNRRVAASVVLKNYVQSNLAGKKFIVLGDWNDDLNKSTYNNSASPFKNLLDAGYVFPTKELTDAGKKSYAFSQVMLDHIMQSKTLDSFYYNGSARVFDNAADYCTGFSNNTSDHFPVYAAYNWSKLTTRVIPTGIEKGVAEIRVQIYPNPTQSSVFIDCDKSLSGIKLLDAEGRVLMENASANEHALLSLADLKSGLYFLHLTTSEGEIIRKIIRE